jgi:dihydrofolate synthase/folylpolyglutamate synthase
MNYMGSSTPFSAPAEVFEWLKRFINLEKDLSGSPFLLDTMLNLAAIAGHPERCAPAFHVAGSKGKGSVTGMIAAVLEAGNTRAARFMSPHVSDFRERISLGTSFFEEKIYAEAGNLLRKYAEEFLQSRGEPSFYELTTLWYFLCAFLEKCDFMAIETGIGGRLDATNIVDPLVSVITVIEKEHTEILGNTLAQIAGEKAGIIKPLRPLVLAGQNEEALEVFRKKASQTGSRLYYFPEHAFINNIKITREGTVFDLAMDLPGGAGFRIDDLRSPIPGEIQAKNAGLAALALKIACPEIGGSTIKKGISSFSLPARFEKISSCPVFIADGAHTVQSAFECAKTFTGLYGKEGILLFGCAKDKDSSSIAEIFVPCFSYIIITSPGTFKKSAPEDVYKAFAEQSALKNINISVSLIPETEKAIKKAFEIGSDLKKPVLGAGSFYLASEIKKFNSSPE